MILGRANYAIITGQVELILNMIKENVPFELIAKYSKLTVEKVRQIAKEHNLLKKE